MGACLSSTDSLNDIHNPNPNPNAALVVSTDGHLHQYPIPAFVSDVLLVPQTSKSDLFVCNSDSLYFDEYIRALDSEEELQAGQIYFLLPRTKLQHPLTASDMAALAVKASLALDSNSNSNSSSTLLLSRSRSRSRSRSTSTSTSRRRRCCYSSGSKGRRSKNKLAQISPILMESSQQQINLIVEEDAHVQNKNKSINGNAKMGVSRKQLQRHSSISRTRRSLAISSFKLRLSTIYE